MYMTELDSLYYHLKYCQAQVQVMVDGPLSLVYLSSQI